MVSKNEMKQLRVCNKELTKNSHDGAVSSGSREGLGKAVHGQSHFCKL